ncbi:non-ribosomal peptide synthetase [Actinomadura roseirufa]|uniref:non-ribosomal peptide synthetase n=1 Tax=Actinomadura roseirufa TaxID=2094049 RepID=UPI0013F16655|nr:non-ribosomal peptide synthetase [Actinomadura roseirufa]
MPPITTTTSTASTSKATTGTSTEGTTRPESPFLTLFAARVAAGPGAPALIHGDQVTTYKELDLWSGRLAALLMDRGVRPGGLVALAADRGPAAIAGVLAVLKAGAGFLGLDPAVPSRRQRRMIQETAPDCVLAEPGLDRFPTLDAPRVRLGPVPDGPVADAPAIDGPADEVDAADASRVFQVVYTSGTTGAPKGVRVGYASVLNRLEWMWRDHPFPQGAVMASHKSVSLVAAPWEMLGGLLKGVPTVVLDRDEVLDPALFADAIERQRITHLFLTPHIIGGLLDEVERRGRLAHQPVLVTNGADALQVETVLRFRRAFPATTLLNLYGMTETSSNVAAYDTAALDPGARRVPVGTPVAGASITVLDRFGRRLPPGAAGEVWISGPPLALGYVGAGEAGGFTAAADGTPAYRTGDRGRVLPTGDLEIVGRMDNQVKVRGYRVELEEIEATLRAAPGVTGAGACLTGGPDDPRLTAGVTADGEIDPAALRAFARDRLPDYMVPARVTVLPDLPLGPNGKLDRTSLGARLASVRQETRRGFTPADPVEATVARVWADLLGAAPADRADNFFESAGHSLLAVRLVNRLEHALGRRLTLRQILGSPTFAGIVERCRPAVIDDAGREAAS